MVNAGFLSCWQGCVGSSLALNKKFVIFFLYSGATAAYVLILKDQIHLLMNQIVGDSYYDEHWFVDARLIATILTAVVIFPISLKKELDFLKYPSYLVLIGIFYVVFDVFIRLVVDRTGLTIPKILYFLRKCHQIFSTFFRPFFSI